MSKVPRWDPEARIEAREAVRWYLEHNPCVAEQFEVAIRTAVATITEAPARWPLCSDRVHRRFVVARFPYSLCYRILPNGQLLIAALRHHSRRPDRRYTP